MLKTTKEFADKTSFEGVEQIVAATEAVRIERQHIKATGERASKALMPIAARVVHAARKQGVYVTTGDTEPLAKPDSDEVQEFPVSARDYAKMLGFSHTYIDRLYRLGNALAQGVVEEGSAEALVIGREGSNAKFSWLSADDLSGKTAESVVETSGQIKEEAKAKAKASRTQAKADDAGDETAPEAFSRYVGAAQTLVSALKGEDREVARQQVEALAAMLAPREARKAS